MAIEHVEISSGECSLAEVPFRFGKIRKGRRLGADWTLSPGAEAELCVALRTGKIRAIGDLTARIIDARAGKVIYEPMAEGLEIPGDRWCAGMSQVCRSILWWQQKFVPSPVLRIDCRFQNVRVPEDDLTSFKLLFEPIAKSGKGRKSAISDVELIVEVNRIETAVTLASLDKQLLDNGVPLGKKQLRERLKSVLPATRHRDLLIKTAD